VAQSKPAPAAPSTNSNQEFEARVSGLSYDASKEDIESHFNTFTTVKSVNLLTDRNTGRSKGMAFVKFHDQESLDLALQNNKTEHMGRWLNIEQAQNREDRQNFQQP
jgi:cold-inducible RNA-binding protein